MIHPHEARENNDTVALPALKLFAVAYRARRNRSDVHLGSGVIAAVDREKATQRAMQNLDIVCPEAQGYYGHDFHLTEISEETLMKIGYHR